MPNTTKQVDDAQAGGAAPRGRVSFTPGPWEYVPSTEHHGPYICSAFGSTVADCYTMTLPNERSTASGGASKPVHFLHEMADPNARLIAAAPELLEALAELLSEVMEGDADRYVSKRSVAQARAAIAKAEGRS